MALTGIRLISSRQLVAVALLCAATGLAPRAAQDVGDGSVFGVVEDPLGALVPGVLVTLRHRSGAVRTVTTRTDGVFRFEALPDGRYDLDLTSQGFEDLRDEVVLEAGGSEVKTLRLRIGGVSEYLTITMTERPRNDALARTLPVGAQPDPCARKVPCVRPPRKTTDVRPLYPAGAKALGVQGTVVVEGTIATSGVVEDVKAASNPHRDLVDASLDAVRQWRFQPAQLGGVPIEAPLTVTLEFVDAVER